MNIAQKKHMFTKTIWIIVFAAVNSIACAAQTFNISYHRVDVNGLNIFYRSAGDPQHPAIILLHGFPSSSVMYQALMEKLKNDFYLVAPDYPGHGYSEVPGKNYKFTFSNISYTIYNLLLKLNIKHYRLFMQDYGAPIGFRLAINNPANIDGLIIQNGNAYMDGFPEAQDTTGDLQTYWRDKNIVYEQNWMAYYRKASLGFAERQLDTAVNPDRRFMDAQIMLQPGRLELFMQLWYDYRNNVRDYPLWHAYLAKYQPPVLITWGKDDTFFTVPGAMAYLKDVPKAEVHLLNGGHWAATEKNTEDVAMLIKNFFLK